MTTGMKHGQMPGRLLEYIEMLYNRIIRHSALRYRSPVSFELHAMAA